jgi:hypothetical protein
MPSGWNFSIFRGILVSLLGDLHRILTIYGAIGVASAGPVAGAATQGIFATDERRYFGVNRMSERSIARFG